eukprot:TRINITY_DN41691_c0_g1_i1.p1 TRINITY_DN41691_c0_g1~~TRINITY_DN41691_c0_g1_i1.p1  ORF type:complete len:191 (+),score=22.25 TRINITY_DN41691_c0_g1_i1:82-654(+)
MASGFGLAAARALSRHVPVPRFRSSVSSSSARQSSSKDASMTNPACSAEGDRTTRSFCTRESLHESILEDAVHDNEERDSSSDEDNSMSEPAGMAIRSRTLDSSQIPLPSDFMDPQTLACYLKMHISAGSDPSVMPSRDSEDAFPDEESDAEEMYSGPLQPQRTTARRDFPEPSEYLTRDELLILVLGFR